MKKKLILIAFLGGIFSIIIYILTQNNEITLVSIGDGLSIGMTPYNIEGISFNDYLKEDYELQHNLKVYIKEFASARKTIKELIYEIKENKTIAIKNKRIEIKQAINKADILTVAIGMDELINYKITKDIKDEYLHNIEELLSMINLLNQNKVIIISLYTWGKNDFLTIEKINATIRDIALTNNFIFVDINKILMNNKYYLTKESYYINYLGHQAIYKEIKKML